MTSSGQSRLANLWLTSHLYFPVLTILFLLEDGYLTFKKIPKKRMISKILACKYYCAIVILKPLTPLLNNHLKGIDFNVDACASLMILEIHFPPGVVGCVLVDNQE